MAISVSVLFILIRQIEEHGSSMRSKVGERFNLLNQLILQVAILRCSLSVHERNPVQKSQIDKTKTSIVIILAALPSPVLAPPRRPPPASLLLQRRLLSQRPHLALRMGSEPASHAMRRRANSCPVPELQSFLLYDGRGAAGVGERKHIGLKGVLQ